MWGATGQAKVAYDILFNEGCNLLHFFDNKVNLSSPIDGIPISYGEEGFLEFIKFLLRQQIVPKTLIVLLLLVVEMVRQGSPSCYS